MVPPAYRDLFGETRLFGPIFTENIRHAGSAESWEISGDGFAAFEAEIALKIGRTVQPDQTWTAARAAEEVEEAMIAVERAASSVTSILSDGPCAIVDHGGCICADQTLIVGAWLPSTSR